MLEIEAKQSQTSADSSVEDTVPDPLPTDVLFGRDKQMFNHVGNVRFRLVIQSRAKEYEFAPSRRVKSSIVYAVVQNVHGYGGRFLKKEKGAWTIVGVTEAIQKVGHALRDKKQHDHKMKAKQIADGLPHPLAAKNKSVEGGCELLLKLGQVCAKEIGLPPPSQRNDVYITDQDIQIPTSTLLPAGSLPLPPKRRCPKGLIQPPQKRRTVEEYEQTTTENFGGVDEEKRAANAILALCGPAASNNAHAKPAEITSGLVATLVATKERDQLHSYGGHPIGPPPHHGDLNMPPPPMRRTDALYMVQERHAQQIAQQRRAQSEQAASRDRPQAMPPRGRLLPSQARALLQAQQMSNLMQAATGGMPQMGGFSFANAPNIRQNHGGAQRNMADEQESSRPVSPPPVIYAENKKDDDGGHWIFYPIKVPNIKLAGTGWKLALLPIDGKGQPIELDPTNIQFPQC